MQFITGTTLILKADSLFNQTSCGNYISGYWRVKNDSLFLYCTNIKYRIDSLNTVGFNGVFAQCNIEPDKFLIPKKGIVAYCHNKIIKKEVIQFLIK